MCLVYLLTLCNITIIIPCNILICIKDGRRLQKNHADVNRQGKVNQDSLSRKAKKKQAVRNERVSYLQVAPL